MGWEEVEHGHHIWRPMSNTTFEVLEFPHATVVVIRFGAEIMVDTRQPSLDEAKSWCMRLWDELHSIFATAYVG